MEKELVMNQLFDLCEQFIKDNKISCAESVYQMDHVIQNAYEFIEEVCNIVGYDDIIEDE